MISIFLILFSYFLGSVNFGQLIVKLLRPELDLRQFGSGSLGATNVKRALGMLPAIITFIGDSTKAIIAVLVAKYITSSLSIAYLCGLAAITGHVWSIWLYLGSGKFLGGKAVAASFGVIATLQPVIAAGLATVWLIILALTKTSGIAAIASAVCFLLWHLTTNYIGEIERAVSIAIAMLIIIRHKQNLLNYFQKSQN